MVSRIVQIGINSLAERGLGPKPRLSEAGDPGPYRTANGPVFLRIVFFLRWHVGTRPDQTHIPTQHVEQLGEFVETGATDKGTDRGNALVARRGGMATDLLGIAYHRPEFQ